MTEQIKITPVILCGGVGSRLWPLSRKKYPKQFLPLINEYSLLQNTLRRLRYLPEMAPPILVCTLDIQFLVRQQIDALGIEDAVIILEPMLRNTAAAIALAAHYLSKKDPNSMMLVLPSDQDIRDEKLFCREVFFATQQLLPSQLLTFGIKPLCPEINYGYIQVDEQCYDAHVLPVKKFTEKPNYALAQQYCAAQDYYWNSGIFLFFCATILEELKHHAPEVYAHTQQAIHEAATNNHYLYPSKEPMEHCPSISIDYAVMEKTKQAVMLPINVRWNDVGTWEAFIKNLAADEQGNVFRGDVLAKEVRNSYIQADRRLIAAIGLENLIVVDAGNAIFVMDKAKSQLMSAFIEELQQRQRPEVQLPDVVRRPWGTYQTILEEPHYLVKKITVNPGQQLSLQLHHHRAEHWTVVKGVAKVTINKAVSILHRNESIFIPLQAEHRLTNDTDEIIELIEVQVGDQLSEDDIVRLEDNYGRVS